VEGEAATEVERDPGDEAPFVADVGHRGAKRGAEGPLGMDDRKGNRVGGRNRLSAIDVGEDRGTVYS
jgi:hypothetical protein